MEYEFKLYRKRWTAVWRENGETKRHSVHSSSRDESERKYRDFVKSQAAPENLVCQIWESYVKDKQNTSHPKNLGYAWKFLKPHFGHLRPDQVTREQCKFYTASRKKTGVQDSTVLRELGRLKAALRWHNRNTPALFEMPPSGKPRDKFITKEEFRRLIDSAKAPHIRTFITLAGSTGGRMSALLELTWDRVDFGRGLVNLFVEGEGKKGRAIIKMNSTLRAELESAYGFRGTSGYVIEYAAKPVKSVKRGFGEACDKAGLDISPHVLRHSAAVWLAEAGQSMSAIAKVLGHSDSRLTERVYAKFSPKYLEDVMEALAV